MRPLRIGFTGTRDGLAPEQADSLTSLFGRIHGQGMFSEFHHGDCVGADEHAHLIACYLQVPVIIHPPMKTTLRAYCAGAYRMRTPRPYLDRNRQIVTDTDLMVATPNSYAAYPGSGTWATIAHAREQDRPVFLVYPDGTTTFEMSIEPDLIDGLEYAA